MIHVVSAERAIEEGTTPATLMSVAQWHRNRAASIAQALQNPTNKRRAPGGARYTEADRRRSLDIADALERSARELAALLVSARAA